MATDPPWEIGGDFGEQYSDYKYDTVQLPPAGIPSMRMNANKFQHTPLRRQQADFSMLRMSEGPHSKELKYLLGFNSRVDPGAYQGAAGATSDMFTYNMINKEDWEYMAQKEREAKMKGKTLAGKKGRATQVTAGEDDGRLTKYLSVVAPRNQPKGKGECAQQDITDPITHFRHEGIVFRDPWHPSKRTGYNAKATTQTWTWQTANDHFQRVVGQAQKHVLDCHGRMHYLSAGEEDLIKPATKKYIKAEKMPTDGHINRNTKRTLAWVHRNRETFDGQSPREQNRMINGSERIWDCMKDGAHGLDTQENVHRSTQCSLNSDYWSPQKGVLRSSQSEPQIARENIKFYRDERVPFEENMVDALGYTLDAPEQPENVPPSLEPLETPGSTLKAEKFSSWPAGASSPAMRSFSGQRSPRASGQRSPTARSPPRGGESQQLQMAMNEVAAENTALRSRLADLERMVQGGSPGGESRASTPGGNFTSRRGATSPGSESSVFASSPPPRRGSFTARSPQSSVYDSRQGRLSREIVKSLSQGALVKSPVTESSPSRLAKSSSFTSGGASRRPSTAWK